LGHGFEVFFEPGDDEVGPLQQTVRGAGMMGMHIMGGRITIDCSG